MPKNNLPQFFEELKIKEDTTLSLSDLIAQFKQQIPINYVEIKFEEGNYMCSTNPKWKDKPLSERYFFTYEEKEIQLDIPHSLLEKLGLEKGQDLTQSLYLDPQVLARKETYKGITIEDEKEVIFLNPAKIIIKDQEIQTDLTIKKIKGSEEKIAEQTRQAQAKDKEASGLRNQLTQKDTQINTLQTNYNNVNNRANNLQTQLNTANTELQKEKGWWDKWIKDSNTRDNLYKGAPFIYAIENDMSPPAWTEIHIFLNSNNLHGEEIFDRYKRRDSTFLFEIRVSKESYKEYIRTVTRLNAYDGSAAKEAMKKIYQYYRDK